MAEYLRDGVAKIFNTKRLGSLNNLIDAVLADFSTILDHLPVEKAEYINDCIKKTVNDELTGKQPFINNRMRLRMGEIAAKYFSYKHDQGKLLSGLLD